MENKQSCPSCQGRGKVRNLLLEWIDCARCLTTGMDHDAMSPFEPLSLVPDLEEEEKELTPMESAIKVFEDYKNGA